MEEKETYFSQLQEIGKCYDELCVRLQALQEAVFTDSQGKDVDSETSANVDCVIMDGHAMISRAITVLEMQAVMKDEEYPLEDGQTLSALDVKKMLTPSVLHVGDRETTKIVSLDD